MSEEKVMIPLTKGKKNAVIIGCVCLMFSVTVFGVGFFCHSGTDIGRNACITVLFSADNFCIAGVGDYDADRRKTW